MKRREFILGGVAAAWPVVARTQQSKMPVIGFLSSRSSDESAHLLAAFRRGLAEYGVVEGQNVSVEYRWALGQYDRLPNLAGELVRSAVAVIVAVGGEPSARAAKNATATIPVVATFSTDPVEDGLVASLNHPGRNVTGISNLSTALEAKRFSLLRELVPSAKMVGVLLNPTFPTAERQLTDMRDAANAFGLQLDVQRASNDRDIEKAFDTVSLHRVSALMVTADAYFSSRRDFIALLAMRYALPMIAQFRDFAAAGGLMSYGIDIANLYFQIGIYTGKILKGEKPSDLPVQQPSKFEFIINMKTAKGLGLEIPAKLLALADEVIE